MDTCRPVIAPHPRWEAREAEWEEADAPPDRTSTWLALAVVVGGILGALFLAWAHAEAHPEVPMAARMGTTALAKQPTDTRDAGPAPGTAPAAAAVAVQAEPSGFVAIPGPRGATVFDGDTLVGTAPLLHGTRVGAHTIRVYHAGSDQAQTFNIDVRDHETTPVIVTFDARKSRTKRRAPAGPAPARPSGGLSRAAR